MQKTTFASWPCTIARTVDLLGDGWTLLVLREAYYGDTRFDGLITSLGIARNTLTDRLRKLVDAGVLARRAYQTQPVRHEYVLTESGREFFGVMAAMKTWGDTWLNHGEELPVTLVHDACHHELSTDVVCGHCGGSVRLADVHAEAGPTFPRRLLENPKVAARFITDEDDGGRHSPTRRADGG